MKPQARYSIVFVVVALLLTVGALAAYREIGSIALAAQPEIASAWTQDTATAAGVVASQRDSSFDEIRAADASWRAQHARIYSVAELRVRGDGSRSPRQQMQDRVFALSRAGNRGGAIGVLDSWVQRNPRDEQALLWLARLLNESGRGRESVARYRQALALAGR